MEGRGRKAHSASNNSGVLFQEETRSEEVAQEHSPFLSYIDPVEVVPSGNLGRKVDDLEQEPIIPIDILNKAQEEASQVAVLSKSLGPFYGEDEAKIMQNLIQLDVAEARGTFSSS
ncbi:hypothetical protein AAC387_Pa03g2145 [Persea americana]